MRWQSAGRSPNIEDRRGARFIGGGIGGIVILLLSLFFGRNLLGGGGSSESSSPGAQPPQASETTAEEEKQVDFISFVLDDLQSTWTKKLDGYRAAKLVLFRDGTQTACGTGQSAMGPFYCPLDQKVYVDLGFYDTLAKRFGAPGDFAQAYVLAHEIGHHVQNLTGQLEKGASSNDTSIRQELQADCFAGVWGHEAAQRDLLEKGDIEEGMAAAAAVGDDNIQREATGRVSPESWTHGSSEMRMRWFRRGFDSGDPNACNTASARDL